MKGHNAAVDVQTRTAGKKTALVAICREVLGRFGAMPIQAVFLYGSATGPSFRPDSDIDIAILDDAEHRLSWADQARLMDALERALGRGVDVRLLRDSSLSHQARVVKDGVLLWIGDEARVRRYVDEVLTDAERQTERTEREWPRVLARWAGRTTSGR